MTTRSCSSRRRAFVLFETMVAVAIFVMAMIGIGRCITNCLRAEVTMREEEVAVRALENRMAEIEAGVVVVKDGDESEVPGDLRAMRLRQSKKPIEWQNEKGEAIQGLDEVELHLTWQTDAGPRERSLTFYALPKSQ